jgi:cbb3-type cytochrome oxidase maturation protein
MGVMPIIILLSLLVAGGFAVAFVVTSQSGQYDDILTPPIRMLFEDDKKSES